MVKKKIQQATTIKDNDNNNNNNNNKKNRWLRSAYRKKYYLDNNWFNFSKILGNSPSRS